VNFTWFTAEDEGSKSPPDLIKSKDHFPSKDKDGAEEGTLVGTPDGTPDGKNVGRFVLSTPSGNGEEVVGLEVKGASVGLTLGWPVGWLEGWREGCVDGTLDG
jgi:hypothetical protein